MCHRLDIGDSVAEIYSTIELELELNTIYRTNSTEDTSAIIEYTETTRVFRRRRMSSMQRTLTMIEIPTMSNDVYATVTYSHGVRKADTERSLQRV